MCMCRLQNLKKSLVQETGADPGSFEGGSNQDEHIPHKIK